MYPVYTTVHAADAFAIARRLTGMLTSAGVPDPRETLFGQGVCAGLICQRLMSLNCPRCSLPLSSLTGEARRSLLPEELEEFLAGAIGPSAMGGVRLRNPDGCPACGGQGILSRAAAAEIVDCRGAVGRLLARGEDGAARELWKRNGGVTIAGRCLGLIAKGLLDPVTCGHRLGGLSDPDSV